MPVTLPATPPELGPVGERVYRELVAEYGADAEISYLARVAALAWERAETCRALVAAEGMTVQVGRGLFAHPALKVEHQARVQLLSALRTLRSPARRSKVGRPGLGERLAEGRRWLKPPRRPSRVSKYISG